MASCRVMLEESLRVEVLYATRCSFASARPGPWCFVRLLGMAYVCFFVRYGEDHPLGERIMQDKKTQNQAACIAVTVDQNDRPKQCLVEHDCHAK